MARFTQGGSSNNGGAALNYVQVAGTPQTISSAPNAIVDLDITTTGAPVQISVTGEGANASAGSWLRLNLFRDNVAIGNAIQMESSAASENVPFAINFIDDVEAGTYNYSARVTSITGGNWVFGEAAGPVINAVELTGFKGDRGLRGLTGAPGADGAAGADGAGFNFRGAWVTDTLYLQNDVVTQDGSSYIANYDYQDTSGPSLDGDLWAVLAQKGADGADGTGGGDADIADFVFDNIDEEQEESRITIANHDMVIRTTTVTAGNDADIEINSADDLRLISYDNLNLDSGGPIELKADTTVTIISNDNDSTNSWGFETNGDLTLPSGDSLIGSGTSGNIVLETRTATYTSDYQNSTNNFSGTGLYLTLNEDSAWFAAYTNGEVTITFADNTTAQTEQIYDGTQQSIPAMIFALVDTVTKSFEDMYPLTITGEKTEPKHYISIKTNDSTWKFEGDGDLVTPAENARIINTVVPGNITLSAYSGVELAFGDTPGAGLTFPDESVQTTAYTGTVPMEIKDSSGDDFLTFTRTSNNTARIAAPQDDLSLRSARDITLFPGSDGEGKVYIGWGDASMNPSASNEVATKGDIENSHGNYNFISDTLEVRDSAMRLKAYGADEETLRGEIELNPGNDIGIFRVYDDQTDASFTTSDWASITWSSTGETSSLLTITGATNVVNHFSTEIRQFNRAISVNSGSKGTIDGWGTDGTNISIYLLDLPHVPDTTVTTLDIYSAYASGFEIDYDDNDMDIIAQNMDINITTTGSRDINIISADDMTLNAAGDDMNIRATSEIRFTANNEISNKNWTMDVEGRFQLPGDGYISNPQQSSGDGNNSDTIHIVPDNDLNSDQYLIIDPTGPNHIHIRPGGDIDSSSADLILGGEMNNVIISDYSRDVSINSRKATVINTYLNTNNTSSINFITSDSADITYGAIVNIDGTDFTVDYMMFNSPTPGLLTVRASGAVFEPSTQYTFVFEPTSTNEWRFETDGKIYGPGEDGALILGGELITTNNMSIRSTGESVVLNGAIGEFLGSSDDADSQIATIGDITTAVGVGGNGEVTRWTPNFTATGLTFTGSGATHPTYNSHYVKNGRMVSFFIEIDMSTVTNFGTDQYKTELPFAPLAGTMNHFQSWCLVDETANPDNAGHAILQADHLANTSVLDLHYIKQSGGANSPVMEAIFKQGSPVTLTTATHVYINGTYITAE